MPSLSKLVIKNGFNSSGNSQITGSLTASNGLTGSLQGNASTATTLATGRTINGTSFNGSESITVTAAAGTLTGATLNSSITGSSLTSVGTLGSLAVAGNVTVTGTLTANTYIVSSSLTNMTVAFASGSTAFGNSSDDTHLFTGSLSVLGSLTTSGGITGSLFGTATYADNIAISTQDTTPNTYNVVFTGGTSGYSSLAIDTTTLTYNPSTGVFGTNKISASSIDTVTGGITGSFKGDGSALTGVTATAIFPTTLLTPITSAAQVFINDGANKYVTVGQITGSAYAGVSGDITIGAGGVAAIGSGKVTSDMIVNATITGTDIAAGTVANSNLVKSGSVLGSTLVSLGSTVTTVAGLTSVTSTTLSGSFVKASGYVSIGTGLHKIYTGAGDFATGSNAVITVDNDAYEHAAIHVKYVLYNKTGTAFTDMRAGTLMVVRNAGEANIAEATTQDLGNTVAIDFTVAFNDPNTIITMNTTDYSETVTLRYEYTLL